MSFISRCSPQHLFIGVDRLSIKKNELIIHFRFGGLLEIHCHYLHMPLCLKFLNIINVTYMQLEQVGGSYIQLTPAYVVGMFGLHAIGPRFGG